MEMHNTTGVNRPGVPWDTSWVFQLGCVGNVENMAKSGMPVRNLWKSEYIYIMLRYYLTGGWCERIIHIFRLLNTYLCGGIDSQEHNIQQ